MGARHERHELAEPAVTHDQCDGLVYANELGVPTWFCAHCVGAHEQDCHSFYFATRSLERHLWAAHALRRTWIVHDDPDHHLMVQLALPIVLAHNTQRSS